MIKASQVSWIKRNRARWNAHKRKYRRKVRLEVLVHYGGDPPCCACCGEKALEFLCIDHEKGGGYRQRKELGGGSVHLYEWLRSKKYPQGFRVLCHNCNMSRGFYGYCPHHTEKREDEMVVRCEKCNSVSEYKRGTMVCPKCKDYTTT